MPKLQILMIFLYISEADWNEEDVESAKPELVEKLRAIKTDSWWGIFVGQQLILDEVFFVGQQPILDEVFL